MRVVKIFFILLTTMLLSCSDGIEKDDTNQSSAEVKGLWQQIGYGRILELKDSTIKVFDLNEIHCMLTFEEDILDFARVVGVMRDTLSIQHGIDQWKCLRIDRLPSLCRDIPRQINRDPIQNYDVFWQNFKEHYCSFELKNIDWDKLNQRYRPKVNDKMTDLELYLIFEEMIELLEDGHIKMSVPESLEEEYKDNSIRPVKKYNKLDEFEIAESLAKLYVDSLSSFNAGMTRWGLIGTDIGYLQINSMLMQADFNLKEGMTIKEFEKPYWLDNVMTMKDEIVREAEAAGMKKTLGRILKTLPMAKSFIIDLRFNGGGKDGVAMEIISHFSSYKGTMARKSVYDNGNFVNPQNIKNTPSPIGFNGPVFLLTSHETASASELVVLCSLADSQFTRIGSNTEGIFSSTIDKVLPNGWDYEFSNEVYTDLNGKNYEHVGLSPDFIVDYSKDTDDFLDRLKSGVSAGADPAIELALEQIEN